jgi:hypothetical protein
VDDGISPPSNTASWPARIITFVLWLASAVIAVIEIEYAVDIANLLLTVAGFDFLQRRVAQMFGYLIFGAAAMAFVIFTGEYHRKHCGSARAQRLFIVMFVVLIAIWYARSALIALLL